MEIHGHIAKGAFVIALKRLKRPAPLAIAAALGLAGVAVFAQIDGTDRGVNPIDSSQDFEVTGVKVDVAGPNAQAAQLGGWREAQRKGWRLLWAKIHGGPAPGLSDSALDAIVAGIVVDNEQIGPNRYIATLGVLFDRVRAGAVLGVSGAASRSAPLLVIPVQWSGGSAMVFEQRTEWQKAWARYRTGGGAIDYVRVSGTGSDPLLLNYGQTRRPGRRWWRMILDQYGAADVLMPQVRTERLWPGGPVIGHFSARFGPDSRYLGGFVLRVENSAAIAEMMDEGVRRMDALYAGALAAGQLRPDTSLIIEQPLAVEDLEIDDESTDLIPETDTTEPDTAGTIGTSSFTIQVETPDVASVSGAESAVRSIPGVRSASTTSLALGGTSVMRVSFQGDEGMLKIALAARGFSVSDSGGVLRISR